MVARWEVVLDPAPDAQLHIRVVRGTEILLPYLLRFLCFQDRGAPFFDLECGRREMRGRADREFGPASTVDLKACLTPPLLFLFLCGYGFVVQHRPHGRLAGFRRDS